MVLNRDKRQQALLFRPTEVKLSEVRLLSMQFSDIAGRCYSPIRFSRTMNAYQATVAKRAGKDVCEDIIVFIS